MAARGRKGNELGVWLASATTPVFLVDRNRRLVAFNAGCETLTGWTAADVVGQVCHYGSLSETSGAAALAASLCPPPEAFDGSALAAPAYLVHKEGRAVPRLLSFFPLRDEKDRATGVLGIALPLPQGELAFESSPARRLHAELAAARLALRGRFGPNTLVAVGTAMRKVLAQVDLARHTSVAVLLHGEPGTGKEHLARWIHFNGPARGEWFVPLECGRLGPGELDRVWTRLLASQPAPAPGSTVHPGTVYLADAECLSRDLQERIVMEFAADSHKPPALRLLSSTTSNLRQAIANQTMRPDFAALISPLEIAVPPLRERSEDLPRLIQHFVEECNRHGEKQIGGCDESVWPLFLRYDWPANLDELWAVVREAHAHAADSLIRPHDLPYRFRTALEAQEIPPAAEAPPLLLDALLTKLETRLIALALARSKQNRSRAAELLGIHRARLIRRIEQLGLGNSPPHAEPKPRASLDELSAELLKDEPPETHAD